MKPKPALALSMALGSFLFFPLEWWAVEVAGSIPLLLAVALGGLLAGTFGLILGLRALKVLSGGKAYGQAMGASLIGGFAIVFWCVLVPFMIVFALPARQQDAGGAALSQNMENMRILIRQSKTFHRDFGRLPVKLEELVEKNYTPADLLYDSRDPLRDAPSYRLILRDLPPESEWDRVPMLEGRWPDDRGRRLLGYASERIGTIGPD